MTAVVRRREHDDSGDYSDASQDIELTNSVNDAGAPESDYDSQGSDSENSEQDPDSKETERRVDDDEDRSNPQYIPKRGTFYEHDDRTAASGEETSNATSETASEKKEGSEAGGERRRPPRKSDIVNKWSHDKYNENEQVPKSREELVAIYGYDIRNEDAPPHARRNRRYGRGPNKYTRTWEDEEAYRRQSAAQAQPRKPPNPEDFPELDATNKNRGRRVRTPRPRSKSQPAANESPDSGPQLRRNASIKTTKKPLMRPAPARPAASQPKPKDKMPAIENLTITANLSNNQGQAPRKVNAAVAQQRPVPTDLAKKKPLPTQPQQQATPPPNKSPPQQPPPQQQQQKSQPQTNSQPPAAGGGSKRYSSLRQRPLADTYSPQPQQQQQQTGPQRAQQVQTAQAQQLPQTQQALRQYTGPGEFVPQQAAPASHQQLLTHQQGRVPAVSAASPAGGHGASPPQQQQTQPQQQQQQLAQQQQHAQQVRLGLHEAPPLAPLPHRAPLHNLPQHALGQLQPSQGYAPPAMMPAQYMQPSGSGAVFGGALYAQPPHAPHAAHAPIAAHAPHAPHAPHAQHAPYQHQMYPHHNFATQTGGVTYYSCPEPELPPPQPRTQRRPTAAIPIVRPQASDRPVNSSEKDNIDRIVENMFVRKPWPAHGADSKEKQSESRNSQEPPSKESSQPNSLTSSSISTDSKPSEGPEQKTEEVKEEEEPQKEIAEETSTTPAEVQDSIATSA